MHYKAICFALLIYIPLTVRGSPADVPHAPMCSGRVISHKTGFCRHHYSPLPTGFILNTGQYADDVVVHARIQDGVVFVTKDGIVYTLMDFDQGKNSRGISIRERFNDTRSLEAVGKDPQNVTVSTLKGNDSSKWFINSPLYSKIDCGEIYPGVSLSLNSTASGCEKVFNVDPEIDPTSIEIFVEGVDRLSLSDAGELLCLSGDEIATFTRPLAFQLIRGLRIDVPVRYHIRGCSYSFDVGDYDSKYPLVIDPLIASTYLGGSASDRCEAVFEGHNGNIFVVGNTRSIDFPTVLGSFDTTHNGGDDDLFVSLFDRDLTNLIASTFIGGSEDDTIQVHNGARLGLHDDLYVAASTTSADFPTSTDAYDRSFNGDADVIVFRLSPDLTSLSGSTYLGGTSSDNGYALIIHTNGNIYIAGQTWGNSDFPTTAGAFDRTPAGSWDAFVACLNSDLNSLIASTLIGGDFYDRARCIASDGESGIFVAGGTASSDFPTTSGAYDETFNHDGGSPDHDIFISRFDNNLSALNYSTFIGGEDEDMCLDLLIDNEDSLVFTGYSNSIDFPTTSGTFQEQKSLYSDFIVGRIDGTLTHLSSSTFLGGNGPDYGYCAAMDDSGYVLVAGMTESGNIPIVPGSNGTETFSDKDAYIARFDKELQRLTSTTILGGATALGSSSDEGCLDIVIMQDNRIIVCGITHSYEFPTTDGAFAEDSNGSYDGFVSILDELLTLHSGKVIVGPGPALDNPPLVRIYPAAQDSIYGFEFSPYGAPHYGVNVACGNLDDDGPDEILTGAGPGEMYGPHVRAFEIDGTPLPGLSFFAYGTLRWGVNVAAGDIDGDGFDEVITGAGPGAVFGPHARAFDYDGAPGVQPVPGVSYFAYGTPKWGVNVAAGDIDGDGYEEIITGAGPGSVYGPHVRGWDIDGGPVAAMPDVSYFAYGTLKYGVKVTAGDVDGDGIDEIITGAGPGIVFGPHVRGWNHDGSGITAIPGFSFFAWQDGPLQFGVNVSSGTDMDDDGRDELVAGRGPSPDADTGVKVFTYDGSQVVEWFSLEAFPESTHGVNVAAGRF